MSKKIGILMLNAPPNRFIGAEKYDIELAKFLKNEGFEVSVWLTETSENWVFEGIEINPQRTSVDFLITHVDLLELTKEHVEQYPADKVFAIMHNFSPQTVNQEKDPFWDGIIYNSHFMKNKTVARKGKAQFVLYPPIKETKAVSLSKGTKVTLVNMQIIKGVQELFFLSMYNPEMEFIGVKGGWGKQETLVAENVEVVEHSENALDSIFKETKVLLVPSRFYESWNMCATEAMRFGIPTVTYDDLGGVVENLGGTGAVVKRNSIPEMTAAIKKLKPNKKVQARFKEIKEETQKQLELIADHFKGV